MEVPPAHQSYSVDPKVHTDKQINVHVHKHTNTGTYIHTHTQTCKRAAAVANFTSTDLLWFAPL